MQGRRRERRGAGVWLRPQEATAAYWRAAMTVELLTWTVEPILSWRGLLQRPGVGAAVGAAVAANQYYERLYTMQLQTVALERSGLDVVRHGAPIRKSTYKNREVLRLGVVKQYWVQGAG